MARSRSTACRLGEYTVRGNLPGPPQPGVPMEMATANVTVNGIDITDVRVEPVRPISVSGHVILDPVAARSFKPETVSSDGWAA